MPEHLLRNLHFAHPLFLDTGKGVRVPGHEQMFIPSIANLPALSTASAAADLRRFGIFRGAASSRKYVTKE